DAYVYYDRTVAIRRDLGDLEGLAIVLHLKGMLPHRAGDLRAALALHRVRGPRIAVRRAPGVQPLAEWLCAKASEKTASQITNRLSRNANPPFAMQAPEECDRTRKCAPDHCTR